MTLEPASESPSTGLRMYPARPDPCPACGGTGFFRLDAPVGTPGFGRLEVCDHPSHTLARLARLAGLSGLLPAEAKKRLTDIKANDNNKEMLKAAREMIHQPAGWWLYLYGKAGNAKSQVLLAIHNEINATGRGPALYVEFARLLNWIGEAYAERDFRSKAMTSGGLPDSVGYQARLDRIVALPVILIDEFDKARMTDFRNEFLFEFLNTRWRQAVAGETATIFAGQTAPIDWPDPIRSRIEDGRFKVVHNPAGDARRAMKRRWGESTTPDNMSFEDNS